MLHWSGPVITLLGVVLGAYGTLLMCREYHPFGTWGVFRHLCWIGGKLATGRTAEVRSALKSASEFGRINPANQNRTLAGVYVLTFSFLVQTVGAVLILLDMYYTK